MVRVKRFFSAVQRLICSALAHRWLICDHCPQVRRALQREPRTDSRLESQAVRLSEAEERQRISRVPARFAAQGDAQRPSPRTGNTGRRLCVSGADRQQRGAVKP